METTSCRVRERTYLFGARSRFEANRNWFLSRGGGGRAWFGARSRLEANRNVMQLKAASTSVFAFGARSRLQATRSAGPASTGSPSAMSSQIRTAGTRGPRVARCIVPIEASRNHHSAGSCRSVDRQLTALSPDPLCPRPFIRSATSEISCRVLVARRAILC